MRIRLTFVPENRENMITVPLDFRRYFISVVKSLSQGSRLFERFEKDKPGYSPYVFSVRFRKILSIEPNYQKMVVVPPITMIISSGVYEVMTTLCNGAIRKKGQSLIRSLGLKLDNVTLLPLRKIKANQQTFKTHSHVVLRGSEGYVDGTDKDKLEEAINTHLMNQYCFLLHEYGQAYSGNVEPIRIDASSTCLRKGVCTHYGGRLTTLQGKIGLIGTRQTLQFLYDFGIGVRKGQGYGLLEVICQRE